VTGLFAALQAIWAALRLAVAGGAAAELEVLRREIGAQREENLRLRLDAEALRAENAQLRSDMEVVRANLEDVQRARPGPAQPGPVHPGTGDGRAPGPDDRGDHPVLGRLRDGTFGR
jgi:cell division protein FtsB